MLGLIDIDGIDVQMDQLLFFFRKYVVNIFL